jgi:S-disulfanyl-L-cysteine oxidoreductase SoxD
MYSSLKRVMILGLLFASSILGQQPLTVNQGVYTQAQASRGQALYKEQCASCHGDALQGRNGPPLAGEDFAADWSGQPLSELFGKIKNTMPQDAPGKLTAQQTADSLAFILETAKLPAGRAELSAEEAALKQINWPAATARATKQLAATTTPSFPPAGNLAQVMRGILFPSSNIIFTVQTHDPGEKKKTTESGASDGGFDWAVWGANLYPGWELVDYAAVAIAESAPLMLTPGRRCENGKPVPVTDPDWIKFTNELAEAGRTAYKASQTRDQEKVSDVSNVIADSCLHCHQVYRDRRGGLNLDQSGKANRCTK